MKSPDMSTGGNAPESLEQSFKPGDKIRLTEEGIAEMKKTGGKIPLETEGEILGAYGNANSFYVKFGDRSSPVEKKYMVKIE